LPPAAPPSEISAQTAYSSHPPPHLTQNIINDLSEPRQIAPSKWQVDLIATRMVIDRQNIMTIQNLDLPMAQIKELCDRWQIIEFAVFGSVLRDDFQPTSDIDVLITFATDARKGLLTLARIKHELEELLGREVDILTKKSIEQSHNPIRSHNILRSAQVLYVA